MPGSKISSVGNVTSLGYKQSVLSAATVILCGLFLKLSKYLVVANFYGVCFGCCVCLLEPHPSDDMY